MMHDIMMILSKHEVDIITKTMQVLSLHTVLIVIFDIFLKHGIDHFWTPCRATHKVFHAPIA